MTEEADRVRAILSGVGCSQNILGKAGLPVGTISGSYKKISDNPSQWEYVTQEHIFDTAGNNDRRAYLANKARLITGIEELACTEKNFFAIGKEKLNQMNTEVKQRDVICKINQRKINHVDQNHIFRDKNTDENKALRVRALPFVLPIIEEYGVRGKKRIVGDNEYQEIVGKADLTNRKGTKTRCAITIILKRNLKTESQELRQLSVFVVDNKVIKSFATGTNRIDRKSPGPARSTMLNDFHSTVYPDTIPHNSSIVNKSVEISIVDITEGNKEEKLVQFAKALDCLSQGKKPRIKRIKADATEQLPNIIIHFRRVDKNSIVKALNGTAMVLKSSVPAKGEEFTYQCHKDMMEGINRDLASLAHKTYSFVQSYFGLPEITTMSKADMRWKGKLIYSPETGRPITQKEWKVFVDALERFMNRNYSGLGERWVLSAEAMGRLLDRMVKYQSLDSVRSTPLKGMKYGTKTYDWISDSVKNLRATMGESLTRTQQARLEVARQSAAQRVANVKDATRNKMQQIIIDGVRDRKSTSQVSQALFDSCASMNRDMQRIADSEYQMAMNRAYIAEEVYNSTDGEKLYFQRFEMLDEHTCKKCQRLKGKVAIWSETPLPDEKVRDEYASYAIWEGKVDGDAPVDILHPWCRGSWIRWNPPAQTRRTDAYTAYMNGLNDAWDKAVKAARKEWERKGVASPTDKTPGYVDRCRELFQIFSNK